MKENKKSKKSQKANQHSTNKNDKYAPQTPDQNRPDLGAPTPNPTTSINI